MKSNYDRYPYVSIETTSDACACGWQAILGRLQSELDGRKAVVCVECYPGVFDQDIHAAVIQHFPSARLTSMLSFQKTSGQVEALVAGDLTDDPVFGVLTHLELKQFFVDLPKLSRAPGLHFVIGTGAALLCPEPMF